MPAREWTVMVYMAGDTGLVFEGPITGEQLFDDLSGAIRADLAKMQAAGSTAEVAVCVQFDSLQERQAFRWVVPRRDDPAPGPPLPIGAVNTGEPGSLSDFVAWAGQECPANRYVLVIWGHGSGWDEQRLYDRYPAAVLAQADRADDKDVLLRRGVFGSTVARIMAIEDEQDRGLCYDDSARDFLDNAELRCALRDGAARLGREVLDVLGLDACLMNMIEVAHQIRGEASYLVGAETVLPTDLWPWTDILLALQATPGMGPAELAVALAGYLPSGPGGLRSADDIAQSVLDLARGEQAAQALDAWSRAVLERWDADYGVQDALRRAVNSGFDEVLRLPIPGAGLTDYVDLFDLARRFVAGYAHRDVVEFMDLVEEGGAGLAYADLKVVRATADLLRAIRPEGSGSLVVRNRVEGFEDGPQPGGLSIYLPPLDDPFRRIQEISPEYGNLDLSDTAWPELICKLYEKSNLPEAFVRFRDGRRAGVRGGAR